MSLLHMLLYISHQNILHPKTIFILPYVFLLNCMLILDVMRRFVIQDMYIKILIYKVFQLGTLKYLY
jgi:hypothetical protein